MVEDLVDLEDHSLAGPHVRDFSEPAICAGASARGRLGRGRLVAGTFDGGMGNFRHFGGVWSGSKTKAVVDETNGSWWGGQLTVFKEWEARMEGEDPERQDELEVEMANGGD